MWNLSASSDAHGNAGLLTKTFKLMGSIYFDAACRPTKVLLGKVFGTLTSSVASPYLSGGAKWKNHSDLSSFFLIFGKFFAVMGGTLPPLTPLVAMPLTLTPVLTCCLLPQPGPDWKRVNFTTLTPEPTQLYSAQTGPNGRNLYQPQN